MSEPPAERVHLLEKSEADASLHALYDRADAAGIGGELPRPSLFGNQIRALAHNPALLKALTGVYEAFADKLSQAVATQLKVGNGLESAVTQGALIDEAAVAKVEEHIADALSKGAHIMLGGRRHELGGTFFQPTILTQVTPEMAVAREETFGPVAPLFRFSTEQDAIRMANDTEFGLASYFYSRDIGRIWRVGEALEYGMVGVNTGLISTEIAPFGGMKESGLGREGSKYGIEEYLEIKYLCMGGIDR